MPMINKLVYIKCNLCGQDKTKTLYIKDSFKIVKCRKCGLVYVNPRITSQEIKRTVYTKENYFEEYSKGKDYNSLYKEHEAPYRQFLKEKIEPYVKTGKLLEVGCACGHLLEVARVRGWDVCGIEISKWASNYGRHNFGLNILTGTLEDVSLPPHKFDVVIMINVLEHMTDPLRSLRIIRQTLKRDGILFIGVPNFSSIIYRRSGIHPIKHLHYFTPGTLAKILKKAGFKIVRINVSDFFRYFIAQILRKKIKPNPNPQQKEHGDISYTEKFGRNPIINVGLKMTSYLSNKLSLGAGIEVIVSRGG